MYAKVSEKFRPVREDSSKNIVKSALSFARVVGTRMTADYFG
jgi:hypothetical protein